MARDPKKRAISREADKIRKRLRRRVENAKKQARKYAVGSRERRYYDIQAFEAEKAVKSISANGGEYAHDITSKLSKAAASYQPGSKTASYDFTKELSKANRKQNSALGYNREYNQLRVKAFYYTTRSIWQGKDPHKRNEYILSAMNKERAKNGAKPFNNIEEAFDSIMASGLDDQIKDLMNMTASGIIEDTDDLPESYEESDDQTGAYMGFIYLDAWYAYNKAYL